HTREVNYKQMCIIKKRKFDQVKKIPISDYTAKFLRSIHPPGGGYFFPNKRDPSQPIKYNALLQFLKKLCAQHDIRTVDGSIPTIHCMRHTYATLLEDQGLPVSHIQRLLGHSSIQSTLRYIHGNESAAREGANRLEVTRVRVRGFQHPNSEKT
ncbi:MAG: tyrosine-type recombinase/integrase, partial [Nannocystaceae bacterium]